MTEFTFSSRKAIQAIAVIMRRQSLPKLNYMRLLKLLYLADRESLRDRGRPILGSHVVAMERGPVMEQVYKLICGQHYDTPAFAKHFARQHYDLLMNHDPGIGALSEYEIAKLQEISDRHEEDDEWEMVQITHQLPEWIKNDPGKSSREIPLRDILEAIGRTDDADTIVADAERDHAALRDLEDALREVSSNE